MCRANLAAFSQAVALSLPGEAGNSTGMVSELVLSGSSLYIAGNFARPLSGGSASQATDLIKVDAVTGALDLTFSQPGGTDGLVNSIALEGDSLYVGGSFSSYQHRPATFSAVLDPVSGADRDVTAF